MSKNIKICRGMINDKDKCQNFKNEMSLLDYLKKCS